MNQQVPQLAGAPPGQLSPATATPPKPVFGTRLAMGLVGVLLAAMVAGLNNRVPGLVLADLQGHLGVSRDSASWLTTVYSAGELAAMPFATWLAITFSMRRFHLGMLTVSLALAALMPFVVDLHLLLALRGLQGLCSGMLIPVLMMAALRFLPPSISLHGLALYALTSTFAPNIALWIAAVCADRLEDLRWVYWSVVPIGVVALGLVAWGIPSDPMALSRLKNGDWLAMSVGIPGLALLVVAMDQGVRLDWFHSPLIAASLGLGLVLTALFLAIEWRHPAPFIRLQMLERRNLWLGFSVFVLLLVIAGSAVALPVNLLSQLQGFRMEQNAAIGMMVGLPQLVLGSAVALLLYQRWVDARHVFALGLACIAFACWLGSGVTSEWMVAQFAPAEALHAIGQPLAIISLLFLATGVVQPIEGAYVAGIVNTLRSFGAVLGGAVIGQLTAVRGRFHQEMLLDQAGLLLARLTPNDLAAQQLGQSIARQASVLAAADAYRVLALLALFLIPVVLMLQRVPAPTLAPSRVAMPPRPSPAVISRSSP